MVKDFRNPQPDNVIIMDYTNIPLFIEILTKDDKIETKNLIKE